MSVKCIQGVDMSLNFGGQRGFGNNKSTNSGNEEYFIGPVSDFNPVVKKTVDDISLFDVITEDELNDTGRKLKTGDLFGADVEISDFDDTKWLGLTGGGIFGEEKPTPQMINNFFAPPPKKKDENGNKQFNALTEGNKNPYDTDWSWNTLC